MLFALLTVAMATAQTDESSLSDLPENFADAPAPVFEPLVPRPLVTPPDRVATAFSAGAAAARHDVPETHALLGFEPSGVGTGALFAMSTAVPIGERMDWLAPGMIRGLVGQEGRSVVWGGVSTLGFRGDFAPDDGRDDRFIGGIAAGYDTRWLSQRKPAIAFAITTGVHAHWGGLLSTADAFGGRPSVEVHVTPQVVWRQVILNFANTRIRDDPGHPMRRFVYHAACRCVRITQG